MLGNADMYEDMHALITGHIMLIFCICSKIINTMLLPACVEDGYATVQILVILVNTGMKECP